MRNDFTSLILKKHNFLFLLPLTIYGIWILVVYLYSVNIPILDQWTIPGEQIEAFFKNELSFETLSKQHNESRKLIPNLIFVIISYILKEWNVKAEMIIGLHFAFFMSLIIYLLLLLTNKSFYKNLFLLIFYDFLLLSPSSFSRWLRGITIHRLIPDACIIINALIFRLNINQKLKVWMYSFFCAVSQYSFSGGIVTWAVSLLFIIFNNKISFNEKFKSLGLFIGLFTVSSIFYFKSYIQPYHHTKPSEIINSSWQDIISYFLAFLGNILGQFYELDVFLGLALLITFIVLLILNLKFIKEEIIVWFIIGSYTIALGIVNTITRLPMSSYASSHASRVDYILHLVYLPLSIMVILLYLIEYNKQNFKNLSFYFLGIVTALYIHKNYPTKILHQLQEWQYNYNYGKSCIQLVNFYQKDDCIMVLFPVFDQAYYSNLNLVITRFKNLSQLNILRPGIVKDLKIFHQGEWGYIDSIQEGENGFFKISGWAKLPMKIADAVILAYSNESNHLIVVDILSIGQVRPDISKLYGSKYINSGWSGDVDIKNKLPNFNKSHLQAYAFDSNNNIFYPLKNLYE